MLADKIKVKATLCSAYFKLLGRGAVFHMAIMHVAEPLLSITVVKVWE
jgi:hypothetical protein